MYDEERHYTVFYRVGKSMFCWCFDFGVESDNWHFRLKGKT